jgi:hypothetical protein
MKLRHWITLMTILLVLLVQFAIPTMQFFNDGVNRWGWQMYSRQSGRPAMTAILIDGSREKVSLGDHVVVTRSELPLDVNVIEQLCERIDRIEAIELTDKSDGEVTVYPCNE